MAHPNVHLACLVSLLVVTSAVNRNPEQTRWSRQLSTYTSDISDWVPLRGPVQREPEIPQPQIKRQAVAEPRILTEPFPGIARPTGFSSDAFSSRNYFNVQPNRQLYLQSVPSVPSAPQNYLTDQGFGQAIRFGLTQPNFPLSQGFVNQNFGYDNIPPPPPPKPVRPYPTLNKVSFGVPSAMPGKVFINHAPKQNSELPKFVDGYRAENVSTNYAFVPKALPQSLQKIKFDTVEKGKIDTSQHSKSERGEEVQLLYVPLEQLNRGPFNFRSPLTSSQLVAESNAGHNTGKQTYLNDFQRQKPLDSLSAPNYFSNFNTQTKEVDQVSKYTTISTPFVTQAPTTVRPKKLKPHQPPLAIFTLKDANKNSPVKVGDVLSSLKNADTIAVLDSVNPLNAPNVFIGPSNLPPPDNYVKFELPYLSNIDHGDNKLKQLPFFVAPLSYNTPNGFAKIPFPSPHIGSVVINSQIKDATQSFAPVPQRTINQNSNLDSVVTPPKQQKEFITQKPTFSYYSTASPKTKPVPNYQSNYYSFEPQTVSTVRPTVQQETKTTPSKPGSFFLSNAAPQYNSFGSFPAQYNFKASEAVDQYNFPRQPERSTLRSTTTTTTTAKPPSTYPSQLLETHNPYSINQAFHFSTPLDYHNYFDDIKQPYVTPGSTGYSPSSQTSAPIPSSPSSPEPKPSEIVTEKPQYQQQSSPSYLNNYSPEIHYDDHNVKYPLYNTNEQVSKTEVSSQAQPVDNNPVNKYTTSAEISTPNDREKYNTDGAVNFGSVESTFNYYNGQNNNNDFGTNINTPDNNHKTDDDPSVNKYSVNEGTSGESYKNEYNLNPDTSSSIDPGHSDISHTPTFATDKPQKYDEYNNYQDNLNSAEVTQSTSTTSTTTKRTPTRARGRPRYTTTPRTDSYESTSRVVVTRRPLRERRPLPTRSRYEPNKISTEKPIKKPLDSSESTTKASRTKTRGRIHYRPSDNEELYDRRKTHNTKEEDLAYQRDVLHQNYPVTLMERMSTVDIEAMTEPTPKLSSVKVQEPVTETVDTENAYTNERASISEQEEFKDASPVPTFTARSTLQTESPYVPKLPSTSQEEYYYQSRSSVAPMESPIYEETDNDKDEDIYVKQTTPVPKTQKSITYATEAADVEENVYEYVTSKQEDVTTSPETETTKITSQESHETEVEENVVQTTPSYNRVRVRPGVIRQYYRPTSTETPKKKRPSVVVTYRPALDKRRTTMRIDEIEADLKTKQVHFRNDQDHRHPVYKPDITEPSITSPSTTESTTKRGHFRRRRPSYSYTTTSTEATSTKRVNEVKNRFRGRRPTDKPTDKPDAQTESPSSTTRTLLHSRYSHRPRLSERYTKKPEPESEVEDQDSNYSINIPKYTEPDADQWSPKISNDSFKPYNPNDIVDEDKIAITERRSDKDSELDIITVRNEPEEILLTVTPASNNRINKKIPDIPPTLEALVEQSKMTTSDSSDSMSTFESMLEEVMKSLDEQDQDEYNSNVMKHKGGEIGEIPPERIISSGDNYIPKSTTPFAETTTEALLDDYTQSDEHNQHENKLRRRGFWKKVAVRPLTTESIETAESQYYSNTVNRLGQPVNDMKTGHEKTEKKEKPKVTTYKPKFEFINDLFTSGNDANMDDITPAVIDFDLRKITTIKDSDNKDVLVSEESKRTTTYVEKETQTISPGDLDLGTGTPDPTIDSIYFTTPTETTTTAVEKEEPFSLMKYLFGDSSPDGEKEETTEESKPTETTKSEILTTTEQPKSKIVTTESAFIPEEITSSSMSEESTYKQTSDIQKLTTEIKPQTTEAKFESSSVSSFMDPSNVLSTSMSTEISHETEICFRGKCIKTNKDIL